MESDKSDRIPMQGLSDIINLKRMKRILLAFLLLSTVVVSAHEGYHISGIPHKCDTINCKNTFFSKEELRILSNLMGIVYRKPPGFDEVSRTECFEGYPELKRIVSCAWNQLRSDDGECVIFLPIYPPFTEKDTLFVLHNRRWSPDDPLRVLDMQHVGQTHCNIVFAQGNDQSYFLQRKRKHRTKNWRKYLDYYTLEEARYMFGADTAYRYSLNIVPGKRYRYEEKYDYLDVLTLQKKGRGYIMLFCFTTEKGKANLQYYWERIEMIFRYQN